MKKNDREFQKIINFAYYCKKIEKTVCKKKQIIFKNKQKGRWCQEFDWYNS